MEKGLPWKGEWMARGCVEWKSLIYLYLVNDVGGCLMNQRVFGARCWRLNMGVKMVRWLYSGGNRASSWWKDLISIRDGSAVEEESWFGDNIKRKVEKGETESCLFWKDEWLEGGSLKSRYGRIFDLCLDKDVSVVDMRRLWWGFGGSGWRWRRHLFAWEEEVWGQCYSTLGNVILQESQLDLWVWLLDLDTSYSVGGAYHFLTHMLPMAP
jgi:hypothetical protein